MYFVEELKILDSIELRKNLHINFEGEGGIVKKKHKNSFLKSKIIKIH